MPVNLLSAFVDNSIAYNLMAAIFEKGTGNQILDGSKSDPQRQSSISNVPFI